jgi:hypothetical protein
MFFTEAGVRRSGQRPPWLRPVPSEASSSETAKPVEVPTHLVTVSVWSGPAPRTRRA